MATHVAHAGRQRLSTPCSPHHQMFGGHCVNCGHNAPKRPVPVPRAERVAHLRALGFEIT